MTVFLVRFLIYLLAGSALGTVAWFAFVSGTTQGSDVTLFLGLLLPITAAILIPVFLQVGRSVKGQGISITPRSSVAACDAVCLIAAGMAAFFVIDGYANWFSRTSLFADPLVADVILVLFPLSAALLAWFVSSIASQRVVVTPSGIVIQGMAGKDQVAWVGISQVSSARQYVVVSRLGILVPRHLRTNLEIKQQDGKTLTVFEPATRPAKNQLVSALLAHAPAGLHAQIETVAESWG